MSIHTLLRSRLRRAVTGERGSLAASFVFVIFTAITMTAIITAVVASVSLAARINARSAVNSSISTLGNTYLDAVINGTATPGQKCEGIVCVNVQSATDASGVRTVTLTGTAGDQNSTTRSQILRRVTGTVITGYDSRGVPVFGTPADTTPYKFTQIVSAGNTSCAIDTDKAAWCWGANNKGQLGDGAKVNRTAPVKVGGNILFASLVRGTGDTWCGLDTGSKPWCWGANPDGQIGTGAATVGIDATTPVTPEGGRTFLSLYQSVNTTCGIDAARAAWCWGANPGNKGATGSPVPVPVFGTILWASFSMDANTVCGLDTTGADFCWAGNANGRTGSKNAPALNTPATISGGRKHTQILVTRNESTSVVSTACELDTTGKIWCWGEGSKGQLGRGTAGSSTTAAGITGTYTTMHSQASTICALDTGARIWCWGENNRGQVGNGLTVDATAPVQADAATTYAALTGATGNGQWFCGLTQANTIKCWGANGSGQTTPGSTADAKTPTQITGSWAGTIKGWGIGTGHACLIDQRNSTYCWGNNTSGQAGTGATSTAALPSPSARKSVTPTSFSGFLKGGRS